MTKMIASPNLSPCSAVAVTRANYIKTTNGRDYGHLVQ